jgi:hypothetical protein
MFVVKKTGQSREVWEGIIGHHFNQATLILAKRLAGIPESRRHAVAGQPPSQEQTT